MPPRATTPTLPWAGIPQRIGDHWHKCADEARSVADDMKDEISKQMMLQIAEDYERLAKRAAHREPEGRLIG